MKAKLFKNNKGDYYLIDPTKGTDANDEGFLLGSSRETNFQKLSKQNCDELFGVVDVEKLAKSSIKHVYNKYGENITSGSQKLDTIYGYKEGFNKAMELNKDKVFTFDDMKRAFKVGFSNGFASDIISQDKLPTEKENLFNEFIQSLQQPTEIEVEIDMQCLDPTCDGINRKGICIPGDKPKLDSEGNLILKKI
jgi:hypothetical protein